MGRHRGRRREGGKAPVIAIAFGLGLLVSLCFSPRLTLLLGAILIIYIGFTCS